jgi:hypothetical protein
MLLSWNKIVIVMAILPAMISEIRAGEAEPRRRESPLPAAAVSNVGGFIGHRLAVNEKNCLAGGKVRVTFMAIENTGKNVTIMGKTSPELRIIVPPEYRAGKKIEIKPDDKTRNFNLQGNI